MSETIADSLNISFDKVVDSLLPPDTGTSPFTSFYNLETRTYEWISQDAEYDYKQEIARSGYADMLLDQERNDKYYKAIKICVNHLRANSKEVHVLDIGTGTGLLSMMAASCGVDSITACEAFYPMYKCADRILKENCCREKIKLVPKRSTEMVVGPGKDMIRKANLLVAELLDTELIGEGAIEAYIHASRHLLEEDALLVPTSATIYAQIVASEWILNWNKLSDIEYTHNDEKMMISIPKDVTSCHGYEFHDIQMSELSLSNFEPLSDPVPVCKLDWTGRLIPLRKNDQIVTKIKSIQSGTCHAVLMWWDINMESITGDVLSCAPYWAHPFTKGHRQKTSSDIPWRDHWMQAMYYLPRTFATTIGEQFSLITYHDSHSLWFDIDACIEAAPEMKKPMCQCYLHLTISGNRLAQLNSRDYNGFFSQVLSRHVSTNSVCLFIGDLCLHALYAAKIGAKHVYLTKLPFHNEILEKIIAENKLQDRITLLPSLDNLTAEDFIKPIDLIFGEPFFGVSFLPWENLHFWKLANKIRHLCSPSVKVLPDKCEIKCVPVQFRDLWKIHSPVETTCGFNLDYFDKLIVEARQVDDNVEPKPLWEYPCTAIGLEVSLMTLHISESLPSEELTCETDVTLDGGVFNGIAMWTNWHFNDERLSTGPLQYTSNKIEWNHLFKQGVYFPDFGEKAVVRINDKISISTSFNPTKSTCDFQFKK